MDSEDSETVKSTPLKRKLVLKHVKKKVKSGLNSSVSKKKKTTPFNFSLSSSVHKQNSLRANNRALAYNLERTKEDLRACNDIIIELRRENQDLSLKNANLQQVVGLKDEEIDLEVQRRMGSYIRDVKTILGKMGQHLFDTSSCLGDAMDKCVQLSRPSLCSSRGSSIGNLTINSTITEDVGGEQGAKRSLYYQPQKTPTVTVSNMESEPANLHEMSVIAEQSILLENITPPSELMSDKMSDLTEVNGESADSETMDKASKNQKEKMKPVPPQRVLIQKKTQLIQEALSKPSDKGLDLPVVEDEIDEKISTEKSLIGKLLPSQENKIQNSDDNKRKTFVVPKPPELKNKTDSEDMSSVEVNESSRKKKDRRGTFVVDGGSSLSNIKDKLDKIEVGKNSEISSVDQSVSNRKERRGTFVITGSKPAVLNDKVEEKMDEDRMPDNDEVTQYFNADMEFTTVLNCPIELSDKDCNSKDTKLVESHCNKSATENKTVSDKKEAAFKPQKSRSKSNKNKEELVEVVEEKKISTEADKAVDTNSAVEFRLPKPGKIVFAASRKELDGTRKPVSSKIPTKSRSKSKVKICKSKEPEVTPAKIKSIFDFHDKTPTITIESQAAAKSVYDLSLNESVVTTTTSLSDLRHKEAKEKEVEHQKHSEPAMMETTQDGKSATKEKKNVDQHQLLPDGPVYYLPLKGCSDDESPRKSNKNDERSRSRSRSRRGQVDEESKSRKRTRSQCRHVPNDEDGDKKSSTRSKKAQGKTQNMSDDEDYKPNSRSRSQTRSKNKKLRNHTPSSDEDDDGFVSISRSRSKGRALRNQSPGSDQESNISNAKTRECSQGRGRSKTRQSVPEKKDGIDDSLRRRTRSQSRHRPADIATETEEEIQKSSTKMCSWSGQDIVGNVRRSRSRTRRKSVSDEAEKIGRKSVAISRSRSKTRDMKENDADDENQDSMDDCVDLSNVVNPARMSRSKSRSRMEKLNKDEIIGDIAKERNSVKERNEKGTKAKENIESVDVEEEVLRTKRNNAKSEKISVDNTENRKKRARSKSRTRRLLPSDTDSEHEKYAVNKQQDKVCAADDPSVSLSVNETPIKETKKVKDSDSGDKQSLNKEFESVKKSCASSSDESDQSEVKSKTEIFVTKRGRSTKFPQTTDDLFADLDLHVGLTNGVKDNSREEEELHKNKSHSTILNDVRLDGYDVDKIPETPTKKNKSLDICQEKDSSGKRSANKGQSSSKAKGQDGKCDVEMSENGELEIERPMTKSEKKSTKKQKKIDNVNENAVKENISGLSRIEDLKRRLASLGGGKLEDLKTSRGSDANAKDNNGVLSDVNIQAYSEESGEPLMKRSRRAAGQVVSYKEPSLGGKLRRGDAFTDNFFKAEFNSPRTKNRKSIPRKHNVLEDSIVESPVE